MSIIFSEKEDGLFVPPPIIPLPVGDFDNTLQNVGGNISVINGQIQSPGYSTNTSGWKIDSQGNAEFNNGTFRGTFQIGGTLVTVSKFSDIQTALNLVSTLGGGTIALVPGTYTATDTITIPSGVTLDGNGATINFGGNAYQILIQGTNPYSTGTLAVNYGSTSVTGTGTTWTSAMVGQSILIGDYWYTIASRASNTSITLSSNYIGLNITGATYVIATTVDGVGIQNITLTNSSTDLLKFRYVNNIIIDSVNTTVGSKGINGQDSANTNYRNSNVDSCTTGGFIYNNVPFSVFDNILVSNITGGTGIDLTGVTNTSMGILSIQGITGVGLKFTNCSNLGLINFAFIECSSHGLECVSGNSNIDITSGYNNKCGGDGFKLTATSNSININSCSSLNNTGWGFNIANANCNRNILVQCITSGNGSGTITDSGTGTLKSATVNDFS